MKPAAFKYVDVDSEAALIAVLSQYGDEARLLAGGQSLVPMMNFRIATPTVLIDLNPVASLSYVAMAGDTLNIGAMTRHAMIEDSQDVADRCPLLHDAIQHVAHRAVRNRGTVGGSLALAYPGAEIPLILVALEADIHLGSARGERRMVADQFIRGSLDTALDGDEYVKSVQITLPPPSNSWSFIEASRRHGDFALAAAAIVVDLAASGELNYVRVAVAGGTGAPIRLTGIEKALSGEKPNTAVIADMVRDDSVAPLQVFGDHHYPEDYRRHLLRSVLQQALTQAIDKAVRRHV